MSIAVSRRNLFAAAGGTAATLALAPQLVRAASAPPPVPNSFAPKPGIAQLERNENPYGPAPSALKAISELASSGCYYANGGEERLKAMIAEKNGVTPDHVMIGSGSTEVLNCATMSLPGKGHILAPALTFDASIRYAAGKGVAVKTVPLKADMGVDLAAMEAAVTPETGLVHICNPNNPTGILIPSADLRAFAAKVSPKTIVLIDEAYNELIDDPAAGSLVDRVRAGDNLIVTRTFSKIYGMAGLRVGYALARPDIIAKLKPWGMSVGGNTAGLAAAMASYADEPFLRESKAKIVEARQMILAMAKAQGLEALPSSTNFVYIKVPDADGVQQRLEQRGILIRGAYGPWKQWSRVSCGKIADVERYVAAFPQVWSA